MPKTKTTTDNAETVKHSVPMPMSEAASDQSVLNMDDIINQFRGGVAPTTKKSSAKDRPVIDLDDQTQRDFVDFAVAKVVLDDAKVNYEGKYDEVVSEIFDRWIDTLWETKTQPENPSIKAHVKGRLDATGLFTISTGSSIKIDMPEVLPGEAMEHAMIRGLVASGVSESNALRLVKQEMSFVPQWELNLTDMMRGVVKSGKLTPSTDVQKSAAGMLFLSIQGKGPDGKPLTPAGRLKMLEGINEVGWHALQSNLGDNTTYAPVLKDGDTFLDRVCGYADTREELGFILGRIKPVRSMRSVEFAVSDNAETRRQRLVKEAEEMIGSKGSK
jgi:hypothetical protein